jgi:hypothetical protein
MQAREFDSQVVEAIIKCKVLNEMTRLGLQHKGFKIVGDVFVHTPVMQQSLIYIKFIKAHQFLCAI